MVDILIDTDTASDDAVALIMALRSPGHVVRGITTVAGNVNVKQTTLNALFVTELCGSDVPVFTGCDRPLLRPPLDASWFHGQDGLSDVGYSPSRHKADDRHAVDALIDLSRRHAGCTLVTLGPLTNVAAAIVRDPTLAARVSRCVIMGGNPCCVGNVTPAAEYNVWCDPEAAEIVMQSGMPIELVGWHLSRGEAVFDQSDINRLRAMRSPLADFAIDCNATAMGGYHTQTGEIGISLPDPVAMAVALRPSVVTGSSDHAVRVECHSDLTRGMTVIDHLNVSTDARNAAIWQSPGANSTPAKIVWTIDVAEFKRLIDAAVK